MKTGSPTVSVVIPTYNRAYCLVDAVKSALGQTYTDYEIIVADDGSTDNTREVLGPYLDRVTYLAREHSGKSATLNAALQVARGEWLAVLDSDDEWLPSKLDRQMETIRAYSDCGVCFTDVLTKGDPEIVGSAFQRRGKRFAGKRGRLENALRFVLEPPHAIYIQSTIIRRDLIERVGGFNERLMVEDTDMIFRLALETNFAYVNEPLVIIDRTPNRGDSLIEGIEFQRYKLLTVKQTMYEGWLQLAARLDEFSLRIIRRRLSEVHDGWGNWHMFNRRWKEAMAELCQANRIDRKFSRWVKMCLLWILPGTTARIIRRRADTRLARNVDQFKRGVESIRPLR